MTKRRVILAVVAALLIPLGLWLRFRMYAMEWLRDASGGAVYVMFWMMVFAFLMPAVRPARVALGVFLGTCAIECSQAWHPVLLDAVRRTLLGRLVLGTTFSWSDFPPYAAGALLGWILLKLIYLMESASE